MGTTYEQAKAIVSNPGKFEGCEPWAVLAYEDSLDGLWEVAGQGETYTELTDADRDRYRLSPDVFAVGLFECDSGFVYETAFNQGEFDAYLTDVEEQDATTESEEQEEC